VPSLAASSAKPDLLKATEGKPSFAPGLQAGSLAFLLVKAGASQKKICSTPTEQKDVDFVGLNYI